jgi:hypothetical protein
MFVILELIVCQVMGKGHENEIRECIEIYQR